jgi:hypothetical protein
VTLPTPDAQLPKSLSSYSRPASADHSISTGISLPSTPPLPSASVLRSETDSAYSASRVRASVAADFSHSWDLATGGLKTLTAKRELPPRQTRAQTTSTPALASARSYTFWLVILACVLVMLISGGVVMFMAIQP